MKVTRQLQFTFLVAGLLLLGFGIFFFSYDRDEAEFKLLKGRITDKDLAQYLAHRDEFFGSRKAYRAFAAEADAELKKTKSLRNCIDLKGDAQTVLYRWVRKAYINAGVTNVPELILRRGSVKMLDRLEKVKTAYERDFVCQGFNPRPIKAADYRYSLGTISEHALGNAIDIEVHDNAILSSNDWAFIETFTGKTVDRSPSRWTDDPKGLWNDIKEVNQLFVQKLATETERIAAEQKQAPDSSSGPSSDQTPIDIILDKHHSLKRWQDGFFNLDWALVELLHTNGFIWGATFKSADLQHFELDSRLRD